MIKNKKLYVTVLLFLAIVTFSVAFLPIGAIKNTFAQGGKYVTSSNGVLTYDENEFEVVEDYSAFVPAAVASPKGGTTLLDPNGEQLMRLDQGKKGLLVKSVQTGDDIEGDGFSFTNPLRGNFEMDFRIFSENSVESGVVQLQIKDGCRGVFNNDNVLSALDIRRMGITITSISNPQKAFTIYVYSGQSYAYNHQVSLSVYVHGESWYPMNMGEEYRGYGIENNKNSVSDYGYNTSLNGTTMSNANAMSYETFSTTVKFDIDTMCVYGVSKQADKKFLGGIGYVGATYVEEDVLVRNLANNSTTADGTGVLDGKRLNELGTLSKEDFADGYTTSITIEKMTSNDTVLTRAVKDSEGGEEYANAIIEKVADPYDRYAKMIIYSVNGQEFVKNDEWTVDTVDGNTLVNFDTAKGISQIENAWNPSKELNATYVTDVKYGTEAGSTKFVTDGKSLEFSTKTPYIRYHGDKARFSMPVYVSGTAENYILQAWTKSGVYLNETQIAPNVWSVLNFASNANWNFDLNDVYFTVHKKASWTTDDGVSIYFGKMTVSHSNAEYLPEKHIQLTSSATNISAEGNAYGLQSADFKMSDGTYILGMTAKSENYAPSTGTNTPDIGDFYTENVYSTAESGQVYIGTGSGTYQKDPYSDVREIGLTVRSTINPSKAFTIYLSASTFRRARTTVRVAVEGESYVNGSGQKGFSYVNHTNTATYREYLQSGGNAGIGGTMGQWGTTGTSYNSMNELFSYVKFDPATMTVYTDNGGWKVARKLSSNMLGDVSSSTCDTLKTLDASDFADGNFTMELFVSEMNTEWNKGLSNVYSLMNGVQTSHSIGYETLSSGYDRKCIIDVVSGRLNKGLSFDDETAYAIKETGYEVTYEYVNMTSIKDAVLEEEITLNAPTIINLFGTKILDGEATYQNLDGTDKGTITFANGEAIFNPTGASVYTFTINGVTKEIKVGRTFTYAVDGETKTVIIAGNTVNMSDYTASKEGKTFVGWMIDEKLYSSEYSFVLDEEKTATATFIDFAMIEGASVRFSAKSPGIRFAGTLPKADYDKLSEHTSNLAFSYEMTGGASKFITLSKSVTPTLNNLLGDNTGNTYYFYASVINLAETQYLMDFKGVVKVSFTTADGVESSFYALQDSDAWRNISEVAQKALADDKATLTNFEKEILQSFDTQPKKSVLRVDAGVVGHVQNTTVDAENGIMYYSFGKKVVAQNIHTGDVTGAIELYKDETGLSDYGDMTYASHMHGGTVGYYDGYIYVPFMGYGIGNHYQGANEIWQTNQCAYLVRIPVSSLSAGPKSVVNENGSINEALCAELGVEVLHIGTPIMEMTKDPYMVDNEEAWIVGGKYAVVNSIDAITFGPKMGGEADGKTYLTVAIPTTQKVNSAYTSSQGTTVSSATRADGAYMAFGQFDASTMDSWDWVSYSELKKMEERGASAEEYQFAGPSAFDNFALFESGNADWGPQGICYDSYLDVYMIGLYGSLEKDGIYVDGVMGSSGYTGFISFMIDPRSAKVKTSPKGTEGESEYILTAKYGKEGNFGVRGFACKGVWWDTGMASLGNGYYYIKDNWNVTDSFSNSDGTSYAQMVLRKFDLKPDTMYTKDDPFTTVLASINDGVKRISILGDSISSFAGVSNNTAYNSTIGGNSCHYKQGETDDPVNVDSVEETWWYQATEELGYELCVNNSFAGRHLEDSYNTRALELHNAQYQSPDVVIIFMGVNDFAYPSTGSGGLFASGAFGSFDGTTVPPESVTCFTEAYGRAIYNIQQKYVGVKVYCCTVLPDMKRVGDCANSLGVTLDEYNEAIRTIATNMGAGVIDLDRETGITPDACADYMTDMLHPNEAGMKLIADCVVKAINE